MVDSFINISIPETMRCYCKMLEEAEAYSTQKPEITDFGVKLFKNSDGELEFAAYYSDIGELLKKIYYDGSVMSYIEHFRNNIISMREDYLEGKIKKRCKYDNAGNIISNITYEYDKHNRVTAIEKMLKENIYRIEYGYDELQRVNSRKLIVNKDEINKQFYRYDILDRIILYKDKNLSITVKQMGHKNELIYYIISDKLLNEISIYNRFVNYEYIDSEININGHRKVFKDKSYIDNIMLKKPYTREDDLDFMISIMYKTETAQSVTKEIAHVNEFRISNFMQSEILPISIRKSQLLPNRFSYCQ